MQIRAVWVVCVWLGLGTVCTSVAQTAFDEMDERATAQEDAARRRQPSFLHRPARDTPAGQLEYARELQAEGHTRKALKQYRALVHSWHHSEEAADAQLAYARLLSERGRHRRAFREYQYLVEHFAGLFPYKEVLHRQFAIANHVRTQRRLRFLVFPGVQSPERALPLLQQVVRNAPGWERTPEALFLIGTIHENNKDYAEAIAAYETLQYKYAHSEYAADAAFRRAYALYRTARARKRDENAVREALSALSLFVQDRSRHPRVAEAREYLEELKAHLSRMYHERALFYDRRDSHPRAALIAYRDLVRQFPTAQQIPEATRRIRELEKQLGEDPQHAQQE